MTIPQARERSDSLIEIKQSGQRRPLLSDLRKLHGFMKDERIRIGILVTIASRWDDWETTFKYWRLPEEFNLEPKDMGNNNYFEIRELKEIPIEEGIKKLDSLFFVLRKL